MPGMMGMGGAALIDPTPSMGGKAFMAGTAVGLAGPEAEAVKAATKAARFPEGPATELTSRFRVVGHRIDEDDCCMFEAPRDTLEVDFGLRLSRTALLTR